ncbi:hypothetical protein C7974DRAFT_372630 [Boeremia exigua]|uniref:uncharacterized protein n=1 Tax=Boeremia exigua TaxID=749465 RepID=UPI001E8E1AB7|nr:uncharacterized protein C7974DRAFT_372630 [Boeremia exigua]KAH6642749.1 hypothetical protein C7974DRAFT_372630 [Boeremia exigua]
MATSQPPRSSKTQSSSPASPVAFPSTAELISRPEAVATTKNPTPHATGAHRILHPQPPTMLDPQSAPFALSALGQTPSPQTPRPQLTTASPAPPRRRRCHRGKRGTRRRRTDISQALSETPAAARLSGLSESAPAPLTYPNGARRLPSGLACGIGPVVWDGFASGLTPAAAWFANEMVRIMEAEAEAEKERGGGRGGGGAGSRAARVGVIEVGNME